MGALTPDDVKWEILGDLVELDWQMIWEYGPESIRHDFPEASEPERAVAAAAAIRELLADGWIYCFRRVGAELDGPFVSADELDEMLRSDGWRYPPVGEDVQNVWMAPTTAGVEAARQRWPAMFERDSANPSV